MKKLFSCLVLLLCALVLWAGSYPVKPGEKIVFLGDSITHGGRYITFLQLMLDSSGLRDADLINCGISGDTAGGGLKRLDRDVLSRKPDRVFIMFGMNDIGRVNYAEDTPAKIKRRKSNLENYARNQQELVKRLKAAGVHVVLMTPTAYDQYQPEGKSNRCNEPGLSDAAEIVRNLAREEKLDVIELHPATTALLKAHPEQHFCGKDLVHPLELGHLIIASLIAEQLEMKGPTAEVVLDAGTGKYTARSAGIKLLRAEPGTVSFRYCPERQALYLPAWGQEIGTFRPCMKEWNRETLQVTGLEQGEYKVTADGKDLGNFSAGVLAQGVDLATLDTPCRSRAEKGMKTAEMMASLHRSIRNLELCRTIAATLPGVKLQEPQSVISTMEKWLADHDEKWPYRKYYTRQLDNFRKFSAQEPELLAKREKLLRQLAAESVPVPYTITITKISK